MRLPGASEISESVASFVGGLFWGGELEDIACGGREVGWEGLLGGGALDGRWSDALVWEYRLRCLFRRVEVLWWLRRWVGSWVLLEMVVAST